jgi:murein tripeptide amidase MpaA
MRIHTELEAGRALVVKGFEGDAPARLNILPDPGDVRFRQWFAFAVEPEADDVARTATTPRQVVLENASACTWARGLKDYRVVVSADDGATWRRIATTYDGKALTIDLPGSVETSRLLVAYYPPYPSARLAALLARVDAAGGKRRELVRTDSGLPVHCITLGVDDTHVPQLWIVAQQHPGEHMAGWFAEGFVDRLLTAGAPLLAKARIHVVPQMNPDGVARAQHRTNGAGLDQNRQWAAPAEKCPEVARVRAAMLETGVDFFLDVHGDETIPYVFMQGTSAIPRRTTRIGRLESQFGKAMLEASTDFQTEHAYPREKGRRANLSLAANWVANTFRAMAFTLEMPFSDNANAPDLDQGWSPARTIRFAEATVQALGVVVDQLRG